MSFVRANVSGWASGAEVTTTQFTALDTDLSNSLDKSIAGDGVFGPIVVTGSITVSAGADVITSGGLLQTLSGGRVKLGDNDYPQYSAARTLTRTLPALFQGNGGITYTVDQNFSTNASIGAIGSVDIGSELIDGATLTSIAIVFVVASGHVGVPAVMPSLQVTQVTLATGAISGLIRTRMTTSVSATAWIANGQPQIFTLPVGWTIDRTQYAYFARVYDESGTNATVGNQWHLVELNMANLTSMRPA